MDAISNNAVNLGSLLSNVKAPVDVAQISDAKTVYGLLLAARLHPNLLG